MTAWDDVDCFDGCAEFLGRDGTHPSLFAGGGAWVGLEQDLDHILQPLDATLQKLVAVFFVQR